VLATPGGVLLVSLVRDNIFFARNLSASVPAATLLIGWVLTSTRRMPALALTAAALTVIGVGTVETLDGNVRGSHARAAARYVDAHALDRDAVLEAFVPTGSDPLALGVKIYFRRHHAYFRSDGDNLAAWRRAEQGGRVFLVYPNLGCFGRAARRAGPGGRYRLQAERVFGGAGVGIFSSDGAAVDPVRLMRHRGREAIALSSDSTIPVSPDAGLGFVDGITREHRRITVTGWAIDREQRDPANCILVFGGDRLLTLGITFVSRPDVGEQYGRAAVRSGFRLTAPVRGDQQAVLGRLRVFAAVAARVSELQLTEEAQSAIGAGPRP
jgi:hypothetical protein